jgi:hypothetical protein
MTGIVTSRDNFLKMHQYHEKRFLTAGVRYSCDPVSPSAGKKKHARQCETVDELAFGYSPCACDDVKGIQMFAKQLSHHYLLRHTNDWLFDTFWWDESEELVQKAVGSLSFLERRDCPISTLLEFCNC